MKIIMIMNSSVCIMIFGYMIIMSVVNMKNNGDVMNEIVEALDVLKT